MKRSILSQKYPTILKEIHQRKEVTFDFLDYQLEFIKAYQFLKLNEEAPNQNDLF